MNDVTLSVRDAVQAIDTNAGLKTTGYGLPTLGPDLGIGIVASETVESMAHRPEMTSRLCTIMLLGIASTGAPALIGLVAGFIFV